jgi:hypothetical protein
MQDYYLLPLYFLNPKPAVEGDNLAGEDGRGPASLGLDVLDILSSLVWLNTHATCFYFFRIFWLFVPFILLKSPCGSFCFNITFICVA